MEEKTFYIYCVLVKYYRPLHAIKDSITKTISNDISGCEAYCFNSDPNKKYQNYVIILTGPIDYLSRVVFFNKKHKRPSFITLNELSVVKVQWKKNSKNSNHILQNSFGAFPIISHYSEGIIKELKRLNLIS